MDKYLGILEHFKTGKGDLFASIVDRIKQKYSGWLTRYLFPTGKVVTLKSVLSAIPSHVMTCFKLPKSLIKKIQSVITRFWWDNHSKKGWIAWPMLT